MEQDSFRKLALQEIDSVYRLAHHLAPGDHVDDLVQETFLRAFKSRTDFQLTEHGVRPYLFKILHNVIYSRAAKEKRSIQGEPLADEVPSRDINPNDRCSDLSALNWETIDQRLKLAIQALPLSHRTVFLLCAVENLRYREIADVMNIPVGTVMSRLHHARQQLSAQLGAIAEERGLNSDKPKPDSGSNSET